MARNHQLLFAVAVGVLVGATASMHVVEQRVAAFGAGLIGGLVLGYWGAHYVGPRLRRLAGWLRLYFGGVALGSGVALASVITPTNLFPSNLPLRSITVIATGKSLPAAKGSEVWFRGVFASDGRTRVPGVIEADRGWESRGEDWVSYQQQPATLQWQGHATGDLVLRLSEHPWSGQALVRVDGESKPAQLFAKQHGTRAIALSEISPPPIAWRSNLLYGVRVGLNSLVLGMVLFSAVVVAAEQRSSTELSVRRVAVRSAQAVMSIAVAFWFAQPRLQQAGAFTFPTYWARASATQLDPTVTPTVRGLQAEARGLREHLPPGALVLSPPDIASRLPMLANVYVLAVNRNSPGTRLRPTRRHDLRTLLAEDTSASARRRLISTYGIEWAVDRRQHPEMPWLATFAAQRWEVDQYLILKLKREDAG